MKIPALRGVGLEAVLVWIKEISTELQEEFLAKDETQRWGSVEVDFGGGATAASVVVYKQTDLANSDVVMVQTAGKASADHSLADHKTAKFSFCVEITQSRSHFTIFVDSPVSVTGKWNLVWARR